MFEPYTFPIDPDETRLERARRQVRALFITEGDPAPQSSAPPELTVLNGSAPAETEAEVVTDQALNLVEPPIPLTAEGIVTDVAEYKRLREIRNEVANSYPTQAMEIVPPEEML